MKIDFTSNKNTVEHSNRLKHLCNKVLPLVYDDSLSYYEILCKIVTCINDLITQNKDIVTDVELLHEEVKVLQNWVTTFDTTFIKEIVDVYISTMIFVEINDGHIVYYIPEKMGDITFNTTGLDINIPNEEYGKLVLSY